MSGSDDTPLDALSAVLIDAQSSGATPRLGALLSLAWARTSATALEAAPTLRWLKLPEGVLVPRPVRKLLDWDDARSASGHAPEHAWMELCAVAPAAPAATLIHFAQFELRFLRDLHARFTPTSPFPFDVVCLHELAKRLYPALPRRGLRPLAGYLGFSPSQLRLGDAHVEATAFVWRAMIPELNARGATTWGDLRAFLDEPPPRSKRSFPLAPEHKRALPRSPGVYRFLRSNGDVLYVGKATDLRRRVASHFTAGSKTTERALEMLTQAQGLEVTVTSTPLEAALLESDEIKRLDPPYNVQLREARSLGWASRDFASDAAHPDETHAIGPLPSRHALSALGAMCALLIRHASSERPGTAPRALVASPPASAPATALAVLSARALGVPPSFAAPEAMFSAAWDRLCAEHLPARRSPTRALLAASRALLPMRAELDAPSDDEEPTWDTERVHRHLLRGLLRAGQLVRRARVLSLLGDAAVRYREPKFPQRELVLRGGVVVAREDTPGERSAERPTTEQAPLRPRSAASFTIADYDRLRVLVTELLRVRSEGGAVELELSTPRGVARLHGRALDRLFALL